MLAHSRVCDRVELVVYYVCSGVARGTIGADHPRRQNRAFGVDEMVRKKGKKGRQKNLGDKNVGHEHEEERKI